MYGTYSLLPKVMLLAVLLVIWSEKDFHARADIQDCWCARVPHGTVGFWCFNHFFLGYMLSSYDWMASKTKYCLRYCMDLFGDETSMKGPSAIPVD